MNEDVHLKLLIPCVAAGAIIGKGGEAVEKIKRQTGARLKMSKANDFYPGTVERVCVIVGTIKACMQLTDYIMRKISERPEVSPPSMPFAYGERHNQVRILVPNTTAGIIIGKSGSFIKQIKEKSGAVVHISQRSKDLRLLERCIIITGDLDERRAAVSMILSKIAEDPHSASCPNCSYTHVQLNGAFETTQSTLPYMMNCDGSVANNVNNQLRSVTYSESTVPCESLETNSASILGKEPLPIYRDPTSAVQASMSPILFTLTGPEVATISQPALNMMPSTYLPDFSQVFLNTSNPRVFPSPQLFGTPAMLPTVPPQVPLGCGQPLLASFYRPKLIPVTNTAELAAGAGNAGAATVPPNFPSAPLSNWLPQTSFGSIRLSVAAPPSIPVQHYYPPGMLQNPCLQSEPSGTIGSPCSPDALALGHMVMMNVRPVQTDSRDLVYYCPHDGAPIAGKVDLETDTDEAALTATVIPERSVVSHTRYCSGESTDSALTASLTSLRLHSSVEDQPPERVTECNSNSSAPQFPFPHYYQSTLNCTAGAVTPIRFDTQNAPPIPNQHQPVVTGANESTAVGLFEYSCMVPQALINPLSNATAYDAAFSAPVMSTYTPGNFHTNPLAYALPEFSVSTNPVGMLYPSVRTSAASPMGVFSPAGRSVKPEVLQLAHTSTNTAAAVATSTASATATAMVEQKTRAFSDGANSLQLLNNPNLSDIHETSNVNNLTRLFCTSSNEQPPTTVSQSPSGLLLVGTLQQVQHALSMLHTRLASPNSEVSYTTSLGNTTSTCNRFPPATHQNSFPSVWTTSFIVDGPLRVDRIQPLSLPSDWTKPSPQCPSQGMV